MSAARKIALIAMCLALASSAHAASIAEGVGVRTCAQFAKDYQADPGSAESLYFNWTAGLMTGMNAVAEVNGQPRRNMESISFAEQKLFLREYCNIHPLALYMAAGVALATSLSLMPGDHPR